MLKFLTLFLILIALNCRAAPVYWEQVLHYRSIHTAPNRVLIVPLKVNLNTADKKTLMQLSGIGDKKAEAIIHYREQKGPFKNVQELSKVQGITKKIFKQIIENNKNLFEDLM